MMFDGASCAAGYLTLSMQGGSLQNGNGIRKSPMGRRLLQNALSRSERVARCKEVYAMGSASCPHRR